MNRDPYGGAGGSGGTTLEEAVIHAQAVYGMDWWHRPGYWPTEDGVIPYHLCLVYLNAMPAVRGLVARPGADHG